MNDILKLARIQIVLIALFVFFKFIRRSVLESHPSEWIKITLLSLPNLFEAIIGVLILTSIGIYLNLRVLRKKWRINRVLLYLIVPILGGIFVITQELKIHDLGGNNIFDKNDVVFSIMGLIIGVLIVILIKPKIDPMDEK
ncbi:MAG: hypothetical protein CL596_07785 [Alteromonas sp.]|nr:hypothetical protein [Alteromonas sp.]MAY21940.1 hypothetical protein [Flavobacteriaceae bacterium]|tara:strand:- start:151 stop:573 length:423 start_codon:yes stop_codon:yes gene_type:complete